MRQRRMRLARAFAATTVAACALAGSALAVKPQKSHTFTGETAQTRLDNHTITLKTGKHNKVTHVQIHWRARCDTGNFWRETTDISKPGIVTDADGAFHSDVAYTGNAGGGIKGKITGSLEGQFPDKLHAQGTWKAKVKVFQNGERIDTCAMATTWQASG